MPGPAPGQVCKACNHGAIVLITNQINEGVSDAKIAGMFGLGRLVIQRHRTKGHPGVKPGAMTRGQDLSKARAPEVPREPGEEEEIRPYPTDGTPKEQLEYLVGQLRTQAGEGDVRPELAREIRLALDTLNKMGGGEAPPVVRVVDVEGLVDLFLAMYMTLQPWPEARIALRELWRDHGWTIDAS